MMYVGNNYNEHGDANVNAAPLIEVIADYPQRKVTTEYLDIPDGDESYEDQHHFLVKRLPQLLLI